jgi:hypothetical protein
LPVAVLGSSQAYLGCGDSDHRKKRRAAVLFFPFAFA